MSVFEIWTAFFKHWRASLCVFATVLLVFFIYAVQRPVEYSASCTLLVSYNGIADESEAINSDNLSSATRYLDKQMLTYVDLATSELILKPVIQTLDLQTTVDDLASHIRASRLDDSMLIGIVVTDKDPEFAASLADAVAESMKNELSVTFHNDEMNDNPGTIFRIIQNASIAEKSDPPYRMDIVLAGFYVAAVVSILLAVIIEIYKKRAPHDGEHFQNSAEKILEVFKKNESLMELLPSWKLENCEAYKRVSLKIDHLNDESVYEKLVIVTSNKKQNNMFAFNLAHFFSLNAKKVLFIDAGYENEMDFQKNIVDNFAKENKPLQRIFLFDNLFTTVLSEYLHAIVVKCEDVHSGINEFDIMKIYSDSYSKKFDYIIINSTLDRISVKMSNLIKKNNGTIIIPVNDSISRTSLREIQNKCIPLKIIPLYILES